MSPRSWKIQISQIRCSDRNRRKLTNRHCSFPKKIYYFFLLLAPEHCLQYFEGVTGVIQSFNWANRIHLADQVQSQKFVLYFLWEITLVFLSTGLPDLHPPGAGILQGALFFCAERVPGKETYEQKKVLGNSEFRCFIHKKRFPTPWLAAPRAGRCARGTTS